MTSYTPVPVLFRTTGRRHMYEPLHSRQNDTDAELQHHYFAMRYFPELKSSLKATNLVLLNSKAAKKDHSATMNRPNTGIHRPHTVDSSASGGEGRIHSLHVKMRQLRKSSYNEMQEMATKRQEIRAKMRKIQLELRDDIMTKVKDEKRSENTGSNAENGERTHLQPISYKDRGRHPFRSSAKSKSFSGDEKRPRSGDSAKIDHKARMLDKMQHAGFDLDVYGESLDVILGYGRSYFKHITRMTSYARNHESQDAGRIDDLKDRLICILGVVLQPGEAKELYYLLLSYA